MPDRMYPPATREMAQQRRELAPTTQAAFRRFRSAVLLNALYPVEPKLSKNGASPPNLLTEAPRV
jgi:hypothetical protein